MIEHRHTKRLAVFKNASLYHRGTLVANCKIKDISIDGMALWAGPMQYHRNTMLEVELSDASDPQQTLRLPAIVVYSAAKALGLMFTHPSDTANKFLRLFMHTAAPDRGNNQRWDKELSTQQVIDPSY